MHVLLVWNDEIYPETHFSFKLIEYEQPMAILSFDFIQFIMVIMEKQRLFHSFLLSTRLLRCVTIFRINNFLCLFQLSYSLYVLYFEEGGKSAATLHMLE